VNVMSSFRGDAKRRTRNLEIPGLVLTYHPGMTILTVIASEAKQSSFAAAS
jgi:hypothetical protein